MARNNAKRQRIVEAAEQLFLSKGYLNTSLVDVARLADIPLGNMYYYHKSKMSILSAVLNSGSESINKVVDIVESTEDAEQLKLMRLAAELTELEDNISTM